MPVSETLRSRSGVLLAVLGPLLVAASLWPTRGSIDASTVGLAMVMVTAVAAAVGGPSAATVSVLVGATLHNVAFTRPVGDVRIAEVGEVLGVLVHVVVAATVSIVVVRERRAEALAAERRWASERVALLESIDRNRSALLGAVSHDLRTPLAAIIAASSDLRDQEVAFTAAEEEVLLATIAERATHLDQLVERLLDAGRLESGQLVVRPEPVDLDELLDEAFLALPDHGRQRLVRQLPADLPPLIVDPPLVVAVLRNLLDNAVRYAPSGEVVITADTEADGQVIVRIADRGPGPTPRVVPGTPGPGRGVGLTIAAGFAAAHGGTLRTRARTGGGSEVHVTLPAASPPP